jgi:hypothetical protein
MLWQMNPLSFARLTSGPMWAAQMLEWLRCFEIYARIVIEFTARDLSFEADTLPAFHGLGGAITRLNHATFHFGIPSNSIDLALLWINLGPGERKKYKYNRKTPSRSWAAWVGQSTYNFFELSEGPADPYVVNSFVRHFYVVDQGQSVELNRDWPSSCTARPSTPDQATPYYIARQGSSEPFTD